MGLVGDRTPSLNEAVAPSRYSLIGPITSREITNR
jgi:hypothetical protein